MKDGMKDRGKCDKIVRHSGCGKTVDPKSDEQKRKVQEREEKRDG